MSKIGILSCGNLKNDLSCSSVACLKDMNNRVGSFACYKDEESFELVGMINCAGCPTAVGTEKILNQIKPLVELSGADTIHLSTCIAAVCPFINKYIKLIEENYPGVKVVVGTHGNNDKAVMEKEIEMFKGMVKTLLSQPRPNMTDMINQVKPKEI